MILIKRLSTAAVLLVCMSLCSCSVSGTAVPTPTASLTPANPQPTAVATANPTPAITQSATPAPTPTLAPTLAPTPTPTPDPLADKFSLAGPYVSVLDSVRGPWIYKDATLSIEIQLKRGGPNNYRYYVADIYTRGPLFFGGFALQNDNERSTELPYKIARRYDAIFGITSDYLSKKTNPKGVMIRNGKVYYDEKQESTLAMMPDGDLKLFSPGETSAAELLGMGVKDSFTFGPVLIKDGKINDDVKSHPLHGLNYRTALGQVEKGHYICITTLGSFTLPALAQLFASYKCTLAYNMDGGHSACMIFMGEQLNQQFAGLEDGIKQRPLPDLMMLGNCTSLPGPTDPVYCNGVDVFSKYKPEPTAGLIGK